jgi:hypothetical protein
MCHPKTAYIRQCLSLPGDNVPSKQHSKKDISVTLMVTSLLGGDNVPSNQHSTKDIYVTLMVTSLLGDGQCAIQTKF